MIAPLQRKQPQRHILSDAFVIGILLCTVKLAGAAKVVVTARAFGASDSIDAYFIASLLPAFFAEVVAGSLTIALVPALVSTLEQRGRPEVERLAQTVSAGALAMLALVAAAVAAGAPWLLRWSASGFSEHKRALAQSMLYALLALIPLSGLSIVWRSLLNAERRFTVAAAAPAATPVLSILLLLTASLRWNAWVLVAGMMTGITLEICILGIALQRLGYSLAPRWNGWTPEMRRTVAQYTPAAGMTLLGQGNVVIDQSMAAMLGRGSVATLAYGTRLTTVLIGIGATALSTALLPQLSQMTASGDHRSLRRAVRVYLQLAVLGSIPLLALLYWLSPSIVQVFLQRGAFDLTATQTVVAVQQLSLLQIPFALGLAVLLRLLSALRANSLLVPLAVFGLAVNAAGDYLLLTRRGVPGIALAGVVTQFASLIGAAGLLLWWNYRRLKSATGNSR